MAAQSRVNGWLFDGPFDDLHRHFRSFVGQISFVSWLINDFVGDIHPRDNLAECRVLAIEKRRVGHADEEL